MLRWSLTFFPLANNTIIFVLQYLHIYRHTCKYISAHLVFLQDRLLVVEMHGQNIYAFLIFTDTANCFPEMFINSYYSQLSMRVVIFLYTLTKHLIVKHFFANLTSKNCCLVLIYTLIIDEVEYISICLLAHIPSFEKLPLHILCLFSYFAASLFCIDFQKLFVILQINSFLLCIYVAYIFSHQLILFMVPVTVQKCLGCLFVLQSNLFNLFCSSFWGFYHDISNQFY